MQNTPIVGYLDTKQHALGYYSYILCQNVSKDNPRTPKDETRVLTTTEKMEIKAGIETWQDGTNRLIRFFQHPDDCSDDQLSTDDDKKLSINLVQLANELTMGMFCSDIDIGCAHWGGANGVTTVARVLLRDNLSTYNDPNDPNDCSPLMEVSMHEAGHVYGLDHPTGTFAYKSIMHKFYKPCLPTEHDIAVIKAIYQSRIPR